MLTAAKDLVVLNDPEHLLKISEQDFSGAKDDEVGLFRWLLSALDEGMLFFIDNYWKKLWLTDRTKGG